MKYIIIFIFLATMTATAQKPILASYYGEYFRGLTTANCEIFSPDSLTAASQTLPFGTIIRVYNDNRHSERFNDSVNVRVNDRGPYAKKIYDSTGKVIGYTRDWDLSKEAFKRIEYLSAGVLKVRFRIIGRVKK